jgi:hypothetical protein
MMIALAFLAMLIPGFAWWAWFGDREQDPMVSLAQIIGVSFSLIILLAEAVFFLGGQFSPLGIIIIELTLAALAAFGLIRNKPLFSKANWQELGIGLLLLAVVIAWRLFQARDLLLPSWVDSQHHYLIIRTIVESRSLPGTLEPYLSMPFYYHYGFHALTALFTSISRLEIGQAMLIFGQVLNGLISLSIYALGKTLWKDWRPALGAALLVSFVTRMPAYYLSWGRYTLITGLILMPLAMTAALRLMAGYKRKQNSIILALLTAGVLLSHYFAAVLLALFFLLLAGIWLVEYLTHKRDFKNIIGLMLGATTGLFMASPWLTRVLQFSTASARVGIPASDFLGDILNETGNLNYIIKLLGPYNNHLLLLLACVGILLALRHRRLLPVILWSLLLFLFTIPWGYKLGPFRPDHFAIVLFIPTALFASWLFWQIGVGLGELLKQQWLQTLVLFAWMVGWMAWGFPLSRDILNPSTVMVTKDDIEALEWITENTPEDARFFINTAYWQKDVYRGVDGGGWILPYTERWALVPTVFYSFSPESDMIEQMQVWGKNASGITTCSEAFWQLVDQADLDWIYIREGVGSLQMKDLLNCVGIEDTYKDNTIHIFRITQ